MIDRSAILSDMGAAGAKIALPGGVVVASVAGVSLQSWVYLFTLGFIALQAAHLVWKWRKESIKDDGSD